MTMFPLVRLVDEPTSSAEVLFDFNTWGPQQHKVLHPDFTLGTPEILGDPDALGVEYGPRMVTFTGVVAGSRAVALRSLNTLARLLLRNRPGWLQVQLDTFTDPVWFELLRPEPAALSFDTVYVDRPDDDRWQVELQLPAQPFAVGERITFPEVQLSNDPATAGCEMVLPAIKGDAPAPLRVAIRPPEGSTSRAAGASWLLSCMPLKSDAAWTPIVWQVGTGDGFTAGTDTGAAVADAAYSGGSYRAVSFATQAGMVTRLSGVAPSAPPIGRYKVLVRVARSDTASTFKLRFGQQVISYFYDQPAVTFDRATSPSAGHSTWVDLGDFTFPRSLPDVPPVSSGFPPSAPNIAIQAERLTGTGALHIDAIKLLPLDLLTRGHDPATTLVTYMPTFGIAHQGVWDGDRESMWAYSSVGTLHPAVFQPRGAFPVAVPGAKNVLTVMPHVGGARPFFGEDNRDTIGDVNGVTVSYQPRYLWLAGDGDA